jgi:hypothetical protein
VIRLVLALLTIHLWASMAAAQDKQTAVPGASTPPLDSKCAPLPDYDCTPKQECKLRVDSRECSRCYLGGIGCANDPECEAAKASQNAAYAADKAACESRHELQKSNCEAAKSAAKAATDACAHPVGTIGGVAPSSDPKMVLVCYINDDGRCRWVEQPRQ